MYKNSRKNNKKKKLYDYYYKKGVYIVCTPDFTLFRVFWLVGKLKNCKY